ncbi:uncharacterized protein FIBRA_02520 [Fibroporia radiculosa]|uniref:Enoyl reductase (ER) domain-containing protein n=1 Tax=Fibroporia radiculosa TaxID=599839 RepID=J4I938_9APHY|nr:uncharacterized protein FIBRA_02520 [Fibroporia radiculosa]CCM00486.1 predicted protein [Fibroporia radiculosa]
MSASHLRLSARSTQAIVVQKSPPGRNPLYHDAVMEDKPLPALGTGQILVKIGAAGFNHRDVWIRKGQYPGITFGSVFGADGAGTVIESADPNDTLLHRRVFLVPMRGWETDPNAPESTFGIMGGGNLVPIGTFAQYVVVERDQVIPTPDHLDDVHAAAWPVGGVTAWRAVVVNARVEAGDNVLITGIGGGVALIAMQICLARGASVYVTSGSDEKIDKAISLGAKAGVKYSTKGWEKELERILKERNPANALLSAIIDSGGGDVMTKTGKILEAGGRVVVYGMTAHPTVTFTMREILKNQQLIGSTMGSHNDLIDATNFIAEHRIVPVISHVLDGLETAEEGFELIRRGEQFGKVVMKVGTYSDSILDRARL